MGCAMSDDDADQLDQPGFREGRARKARPSCVSAPPTSTHQEITMLKAPHPFDALMDITARPQTVFVRGEGSWLWDDTGKRYLDFIQGWAVNCLGHAPSCVAEAVAEQAKLLITQSPSYYNAASLNLAKALVDASCFDQVFFGNSGAEANEGAIKLARKFGAKHKGGAFEIITFEGGFHGRTLATLSASGKKAFEPLFEPRVAGFRKAQLTDMA